MNNLKITFQENLNGIAETLISLYKIEFKKEVSQLSCPLTRWLDFRMRYIDPKPRKLVESNAFPKKLSDVANAGFTKLKHLMQTGVDINPYQSKSIIRFNDVSGKKKSKRTDLLWAEWGIFHLHITDIPLEEGAEFSSRECSDGKNWLLFCLVDHSTIALIDIREHNEKNIFSNDTLIKTIHESWPQFMESFLLKGMMPSRAPYSSAEISKLRATGLSAPLILDGKAYIGPGLGVTSAATSERVMWKVRDVRYWVNQISEIAVDPQEQVQIDINAYKIENPSISLCITPQGLAIHEATRNVAYNFTNKNEPECHLSQMYDLLFPSWASEKIKREFNFN